MIGIASPAFCSLPFDEIMRSISEHFSLWEILPEGRHDMNEVRKWAPYGRDSLSMKFQFHAPMTDVNIGSVYEPMRLAAIDQVRSVLVACRELDVKTVTVHPGFVNGIAFLDRSKVFDATRRSVLELSKVAEEHSVQLALENMPANINATCTTADELLEAIEGTDVGICFDMGHANTANQQAQLLKHARLFRNVHLHNNEGQWDQHNRVDDGTADLEAVLRALTDSYKGNAIIESAGLTAGVESRLVLDGRL